LAKDLAQRLEKAGIRVFSVEGSTISGDRIETVANRGLREADEVFVILTDNSTNSPGLMSEMGAAYSLGKRVTPVALNVDDRDLPPVIDKDKYVKWSELPVYISRLQERAATAGKL
jgi:hypothetical protein